MRSTEDIDFLLPLDEVNGRKVIDALSVLPDKASLEMDSKRFKDGQEPKPIIPVIDFIHL